MLKAVLHGYGLQSIWQGCSFAIASPTKFYAIGKLIFLQKFFIVIFLLSLGTIFEDLKIITCLNKMGIFNKAATC